MKIYSFVQQGIELTLIEVELELMPGLPQFQIMGLPDASIKESQLRIKSALRHQGYDLPVRQQVLVNLRPAFMRKSSRGLDLAIAVAYLWRTGQLQLPEEFKDGVVIYAELSLDGTVRMPDDLDGFWKTNPPYPVLTGKVVKELPFPVFSVDQLKELSRPHVVATMDVSQNLIRPPLPALSFHRQAARLLAIAATGEHSVLLAGPSGSGKSTLSEALYSLLRDPAPDEFRQIRQIGRLTGREVRWRPLVQPHHSIPPMAMIGGGFPAFPGEITRAHGGVLILDELLEFHGHVKEALREPMERGEITIARRGRNQKFPARFQAVATTNLCPCGDFVPGRMTTCRFSLTRCRSYSERLSGPLMDRFDILAFSHEWSPNPDVTLDDVLTQVRAAQAFAARTRGQRAVNARLDSAEIEASLEPVLATGFLPDTGTSRRRKTSILKIARTVADLEQSERIGPAHLDEAARWAWRSFWQLKTAFG